MPKLKLGLRSPLTRNLVSASRLEDLSRIPYLEDHDEG